MRELTTTVKSSLTAEEEEKDDFENECSIKLAKKTIFQNAIEIISKVYYTVPSNFSVRKKTIQYLCDTDECTIYIENENIVNKEPIGYVIGLANLPVDVILKIFSYLDVYSLCKVAFVNRLWCNLSNDTLLWDIKLKTDLYKWEIIDHLSQPDLHKEMTPELSTKSIYLQCCPECRHLRRPTIKIPMHIPNLSYLFGFKIPRIIMFGSGLDSSGLVRQILCDQRSPFTVKGMFPGQFEGLGSGVKLQYSGGTINLICMYALSQAERGNQDINGERQSRLLVGEQREIPQSVKELCCSVDAFIYIVDGSSKKSVQFGCEEFRAIINDRWLQPKVPVLILCLVSNATVKSFPSVCIADQLSLLQLTRPWQVRQCHVNSLYGFTPGVDWLNKQIIGI